MPYDQNTPDDIYEALSSLWRIEDKAKALFESLQNATDYNLLNNPLNVEIYAEMKREIKLLEAAWRRGRGKAMSNLRITGSDEKELKLDNWGNVDHGKKHDLRHREITELQ